MRTSLRSFIKFAVLKEINFVIDLRFFKKNVDFTEVEMLFSKLFYSVNIQYFLFSSYFHSRLYEILNEKGPLGYEVLDDEIISRKFDKVFEYIGDLQNFKKPVKI